MLRDALSLITLVKVKVVDAAPGPADRTNAPSVSVNTISLLRCSAGEEQRGRGEGALSKSYFFPFMGSQSGNLSEGGVCSPSRGFMGLYYN